MWWWCREVGGKKALKRVRSAVGASTLAAAIAVSLPTPTVGADFSYAPLARAQMRLDDNIRGSSVDKEGAWGFDFGGGVRLFAETPTFKSELTPRFNIRRFVVGDDLDADEYSVNTNNEWIQERYVLALDFTYERDSTLSTEATDTGRQNDVVDRDSITLNPTVSYFINSRMNATGGFFFTDVSYIDAETSNLFDYTYMQASGGLTYALLDNAQAFASIFVSKFDTPDLEGETRSYGGQVGMTWQWSETLETTGTLGWISSDIEFLEQQIAVIVDPLPRLVIIDLPQELTTSGPIASVSIRKEFESTVATFDYARQVAPSGRGAQSTADRISLNLEKRLNEKLSLIFDGLHEMRTAEGDFDIGALNRDYSELRGSIRYRFSQEVSTVASYRFAHRERSFRGASAKADSNSIFLTLIFAGVPAKFWSGP